MKQILSDFIRRRTGMLIKCALIAAGFAAAAWIPLMFSGGGRTGSGSSGL